MKRVVYRSTTWNKFKLYDTFEILTNRIYKVLDNCLQLDCDMFSNVVRYTPSSRSDGWPGHGLSIRLVSPLLKHLNQIVAIFRWTIVFSRIAAKKPLLSVWNVRNRFQWCKCYAKVDPIFWNDVIFSDESRLELFSRRKYVSRPQGSRYNPKYTTKTVKFGGKCIIVWGAIKADGIRILIRCPDSMNFIGYEEVLKKELLPIYEAHNTFQHDGASCHKSLKLTVLINVKLKYRPRSFNSVWEFLFY